MRRGSEEQNSARVLCEMYSGKYIAVKVIEHDPMDTEILKCQVLKVYDSLEDCKMSANELKFFQKLYKEQFDVIYGDYDDYKKTRCIMNVFDVLGGIAFQSIEILDSIVKALEKDEEK